VADLLNSSHGQAWEVTGRRRRKEEEEREEDHARTLHRLNMTPSFQLNTAML